LPQIFINVVLFISHGPVSFALFLHEKSPLFLKMNIGIATVNR